MSSPPSTSPTSWLRRHLHQHPATVGMFSGIHKPSLDIRYVTISDGLSSSPTSAIDVEINKSAINSDYGDGLAFFLASFSNPSDTSMTFGGRLGLMNETPLLTAVVDPFVAVVFGTYSSVEIDNKIIIFQNGFLMSKGRHGDIELKMSMKSRGGGLACSSAGNRGLRRIYGLLDVRWRRWSPELRRRNVQTLLMRIGRDTDGVGWQQNQEVPILLSSDSIKLPSCLWESAAESDNEEHPQEEVLMSTGPAARIPLVEPLRPCLVVVEATKRLLEALQLNLARRE
nr:seed lectin-like [Ipomoea batatas]